MSKCDMCIDRLEKGVKPICVLSCSLRALEFGPIDELSEKYGNLRRLEDIPKDYAPCRVACPAGVDAEGYVKLIAEGKLKEAVELFRETTPFAGVLGRVCTHPCEMECQRGGFDEAVAICSLKRFMADYGLREGREKATPIKRSKEDKVAIIGSGPAGLACAYDLVRQGYPVTVFEAAPQSGGLLRYGIPEYRLPREVLDDEISYIEELGVEVKTNTPVKDLSKLFGQGYKAVFIATGARLSQKMGIPGEDAKGVIYALDFLRQVNSGIQIDLGRRVAIVGGGSVAIDAARAALRLGAKEAHLICLECRDLTSKDRMLAQEWEIKEAEEEGVIIHPCLGIRRILTRDEMVAGLETIACISVRDEDGRFAPRFKEGTVPTIEADNVIVAIGQAVDRSMLPGGLGYTAEETVSVDPVTLQTSIEGVFAGGDVVAVPGDIIGAIAAGKEAAMSIGRYLSGVDLKQGRRPPAKIVRERVEIKSARPPVLEVGKRKALVEVNLGFDEKTAIEQANRCLNCGVTMPAIVFKPADPKKQIIPWDYKIALELWQKRHPDNGEPLPDIFTEISEVTQVPEDIIGRNKLVLKAKNTEELMFYTTDDE